MGHEFSDQDKAVLRMAVEQLWRKGCHNEQESMVASMLGQIVNRIHTPSGPKQELFPQKPLEKPAAAEKMKVEKKP